MEDSFETKLKNWNQPELAEYYATLNSEDKEELRNSLVDVELSSLILKNAGTVNQTEEAKPTKDCVFKSALTEEELAKYRSKGLKLISEGKVTLVILAGGYGSRLGVNYNKCFFNVGLPSNKTILDYHMDKVNKVLSLAKEQEGSCISPDIVILLNENVSTEMEKFLSDREYYGIPKENFKFLKSKESILSFDTSGKFILSSKTKIKHTNNGNGQLLTDLQQNKHLIRDSAEFISVCTNDNPLIKLLDPVFLGCLADKQFGIGAKSVSKSYPEEKVGVFAKRGDKTVLLDYSVLTEEMAKMTDEEGKLAYSESNVVHYLIKRDVLLKGIDSLSDLELQSKLYNKITRQTTLFDYKKGEMSEGAYFKFELFLDVIFDYGEVMLFSVDRKEEFAPIKSKEGKDTPENARKIMFAYFKSLLEANGKKSEGDVEISFLKSFEGENLTDLPETVTEKIIN